MIHTRPRTAVPVMLLAALALVSLLATGCNRDPAATGIDDPLPSAVEETLDPFPSVDKPSLPAGLETDKPHGSSAATTTRTDSDWGRIWDSLPTGFPIPPGATSSEEAGSDGPVSATYAVAGTDAATIAAWMQAELELATYSTEALSGPLEDGSFVIDSVGDAGCRLETGVRPAGDTIILTIRYGADCPFG